MRLDGDSNNCGVMPRDFATQADADTDVEVWVATGFNGLPFPIPAHGHSNDSGRDRRLRRLICAGTSEARRYYIESAGVSTDILRQHRACAACSCEEDWWVPAGRTVHI